ncbi:MAG: MxaK protein [Methylophilaceae bacterium]
MARMIFWRDILAWAMLTVTSIVILGCGWYWYQASLINNALSDPHQVVTNQSIMNAPEIRFLAAQQAANKEDTTKALSLYGELDRDVPREISALAKYNMGNIYLQTALTALREEGALAYNEASPLLAMAKESYRQSLRLAPEYWNARHNMELAQRASPDLTPGIRNEQEQDETEELKTSTERAWPTIPGFPKGMP